MAYFRTKTVTIEAVQWKGDNLKEVIEFTGMHKSVKDWPWESYERFVSSHGFLLFTRTGHVAVEVGYYIIKNAIGDFQVISKELFEARYDPT